MTIMSTTRTRKRQPSSPSSESSAVYDEDLGLQGIKTKQTSAKYSKSTIRISMKLTNDDVKKLEARKVRTEFEMSS